MKQTAVEWIIDQLEAPCRGIPSHIKEKALEMEKQQMKEIVQDELFHEEVCPNCGSYDWSYHMSIEKIKCGDCRYSR